MTKRIYIQVEAFIPDDMDEFEGAIIDDFNRNTGIALLSVEAFDIDADYDVVESNEGHEFWGEFVSEKIQILFERECSWHGRPILNAEDVCWELEDMRH